MKNRAARGSHFYGIANLYTFGGRLSRIDQAPDRRDCPLLAGPTLDASSRVFSCQAFDRSVGVRLDVSAERLECGVFHQPSAAQSVRVGRGQTAIARSRLLFNQANDRIRKPSFPACFRTDFRGADGKTSREGKNGRKQFRCSEERREQSCFSGSRRPVA